jgi:hypothetical protein
MAAASAARAATIDAWIRSTLDGDQRAIRTRIRLLAVERGLTQSDIQAALTVPLWSHELRQTPPRQPRLVDLRGDLKGLLKTVRMRSPSRQQQDDASLDIRRAQLLEFERRVKIRDKRHLPVVLVYLRRVAKKSA